MTDAAPGASHNVVLGPATADDAEVCAAIFNRFVDDTPWMPRVHDRDDVRRYYRTVMLPENDVVVVRSAGEVVGFAAIERREASVAALYIVRERRRAGLGARLLGEAARRHPQGFRLWTFEANIPALAFYEAQGLREVRRTAGDNEEKLPDILLEWRPPA